jgi:drug/metabolite transporter (DMT)-like permease
MNTSTVSCTPTGQADRNRLVQGVAVGLAAASIGALYTVYARWGIAHGLTSPDLTVLRFGVAGIVMLPVFIIACWRDVKQLTGSGWIWLQVALLAGTPFGLLMYGALQFAPTSHAAVFPFTAMSVMGMVLGTLVLGEPMTLRRVLGIAVVLTGLVLVSGVEASSLNGRASIGDVMFLVAGTLWAGFGIVLRKHRLDPLLATAIISISALLTYVPAYAWFTGGKGLASADPWVLGVEVLVQGVIAGSGTLYTYSKLVSILGPSRAAVFPALAPGLAALLAWPVLGHVPTVLETMGLVLVMAGLITAVTVANANKGKMPE